MTGLQAQPEIITVVLLPTIVLNLGMIGYLLNDPEEVVPKRRTGERGITYLIRAPAVVCWRGLTGYIYLTQAVLNGLRTVCLWLVRPKRGESG